MSKPSPSNQDAIEVEVVEIDGVTPQSSAQSGEHSHSANSRSEARGDWQKWQTWSGNVRKLDARWWPLWVVLGIVAIFLLLTVGVVLGALFLVARVIRNFLLGFASLFSPAVRATELRR